MNQELPNQTEAAASRWRVGALVASALAIRLLYFTGLMMGDDQAYAAQAIAHAAGSWPPAPWHWQTRIGITLPTTLAIRLLGLVPIAFVAWPLAASLAKVLVCRRMAREFTDVRTADLAALFLAAYPLEIIYSTHLFPDVIVSLFSTLSLWYWIRALRGDRARDYAWSGAFFAAGYLCRETVIMEGPIYLALWALEGRIRRPRMAWVALVPALVLGLECGLYAATAGTASYRWDAMRAQQRNPDNILLVNTPTAGGNFWTDPLLMTVTSHEFGLFLIPSLAVAIPALRGRRATRSLAIWMLFGYVWLCYGTTVPTRWVVLQRDPRYLAILTVPGVILLADFLRTQDRRVRRAAAAVLVVAGAITPVLEQGNTVLSPNRRLLETRYARGTTLEPAEYFATRWVLGLSRDPGFDCASDLGHIPLIRALAGLENMRRRPIRKARYLVISPNREPAVMRRLRAEGWTEADTIPGEPTPARALAARLLRIIPSQRERADRIAHPPSLVVLSNPDFRAGATGSASSRR